MNVGAAPAVWGVGGRGGAADEPRQAARLPHHRHGQAGGPLARHRARGGLASITITIHPTTRRPAPQYWFGLRLADYFFTKRISNQVEQSAQISSESSQTARAGFVPAAIGASNLKGREGDS